MIKKAIGCFLDLKVIRSYSGKRKYFRKNIIPGKSDPDFRKKFTHRWSDFKLSIDPDYPLYCSSINSVESADYVPETIYYGRIEPVLNNKAFALAYADKNFYERYFPENKGLFPETILRGINGNFYDSQYRLVTGPIKPGDIPEENPEYILKPAVETSGGSNVVLVQFSSGSVIVSGKTCRHYEFINVLKRDYHCNFVLQKKISAHPWFRDFNPSSLNTVRLFTYRSVLNEEVHPVQAVIRFGRPGSIVDNQAAGGLTCGINKQGGLNGFVIDKYGKKYTDFAFLSAKKEDIVPGFDQMKKIANQLAAKYYYHRLLGFDFCLDSGNNVRLLEINCKNIEINFLQMNNGPLFWDHTEEVIKYCKENKRVVVLDFSI
jgi:hypothetical protein